MLLPQEWNVPRSFCDRLGDGVGRQRAMAADGHLLLVLHKVPQSGVPEREGILFWRDPNGQWVTTGRGEGIGALRRHVEEFAAAVDGLEAAYEQANDAESFWHIIGGIVPLHRSVTHLHSVLQAAREAVSQDRDLITLRDRAGEVDRAADLLHTDALNGMSYTLARRSEELARSSHELNQAGHRINLLAAVFLPLTAVASAFGTNLRSGLEPHGPLAFWLMLAAAIALGFAVRNWMTASPPASRLAQPTHADLGPPTLRRGDTPRGRVRAHANKST